jgi:hypothetical protein
VSACAHVQSYKPTLSRFVFLEIRFSEEDLVQNKDERNLLQEVPAQVRLKGLEAGLGQIDHIPELCSDSALLFQLFNHFPM